jgi:CRISPR-associated protein Csb2
MAIGDVTDDLRIEDGSERWIPGRLGGPVLRHPVDGTLADLERKHEQFLGRLDGGIFRPVPPLSTFAIEPYGRAADPVSAVVVAFRLLDPVRGGRLSLGSPQRSRDVAAWVRHAVAEACEGWPFGSTAHLIHGHAEGNDAAMVPRGRLSFLPLPTINARLGRVEGIARVAVVGPPNRIEEMKWIRARLGGRELVWGGRPMAVLEPLPADDWVLGRYAATADAWATVTPVVLPGYDDGQLRKAERLVKRAFAQAGFEPEVVASIRELELRKVGFHAGVEHASRYLPPDKVSGPMFHVRVRFSSPIAGPLSIGSGRYRGMGVFAVE